MEATIAKLSSQKNTNGIPVFNVFAKIHRQNANPIIMKISSDAKIEDLSYQFSARCNQPIDHLMIDTNSGKQPLTQEIFNSSLSSLQKNSGSHVNFYV
ncbi:hypothetical protein TRFO_43151 [Tritrichomonas foetus]|uniref:Uncharacterized protein n=1 Tax=Tritrichomonas foetus TaxID=1144522 RepID=A0A1J4KWV1_9EUKA|nr:hypothetical protein TRFO_43151 [Tritrichomonas foetus]|eukprot:OHT14182.1 hypothetical protein TRFO_43151 [Tritrichomonas foetus]